jgi:hypothetical protein
MEVQDGLPGGRAVVDADVETVGRLAGEDLEPRPVERRHQLRALLGRRLEE